MKVPAIPVAPVHMNRKLDLNSSASVVGGRRHTAPRVRQIEAYRLSALPTEKSAESSTGKQLFKATRYFGSVPANRFSQTMTTSIYGSCPNFVSNPLHFLPSSSGGEFQISGNTPLGLEHSCVRQGHCTVSNCMMSPRKLELRKSDCHKHPLLVCESRSLPRRKSLDICDVYQ